MRIYKQYSVVFFFFFNAISQKFASKYVDVNIATNAWYDFLLTENKYFNRICLL